MGVAILPESTNDYAAHRGIMMKRIINPTMESEILAAYSRFAVLPDAARLFVRFLCEKEL